MVTIFCPAEPFFFSTSESGFLLYFRSRPQLLLRLTSSCMALILSHFQITPHFFLWSAVESFGWTPSGFLQGWPIQIQKTFITFKAFDRNRRLPQKINKSISPHIFIFQMFIQLSCNRCWNRCIRLSPKLFYSFPLSQRFRGWFSEIFKNSLLECRSRHEMNGTSSNENARRNR